MREFKIRTEQRFAVSEADMRKMLGDRGNILDSDDDKEVEWEILQDSGFAYDLNILGALGLTGLRIQIQALTVPDPEQPEAPDEELAPEDVAALLDDEAPAGNPT